MALNCSCDELFGNLGTLPCREGFGPAKKLLFTALEDSTGAKNYLDPALMSGAAYWNGLINEADKSARIYPSPTFKTVTNERSDSAFEDFPDQSTEKLNNGIRSILATLTQKGGASPQLVKQLEKGGCIAGGVYIVDNCGNVIGLDNGDGFLYPIPYDNGSWDVRLNAPIEGEAVLKNTLGFNFTSLLDDGDLNLIAAADTNAEVLSLNGLLDAVITTSNPTTTSFDASIEYIYSTVGQTNPITGLLGSDFTLFNENDQLAVTIVTADEGPDGFYPFTFDPQGNGDVLTLTVVKDGLEMSTATITIP